MNILVEHKKELIDLSEILIEKEVLDADQVIHILKHGKLPDEKNDATDLAEASETDEDLFAKEKKDEPKNKDSDSEKD